MLDDWHAARVNATLRADSLGQRGFRIDATADTIGKGAHVADQLRLIVARKARFAAILPAASSMVALTGSGGGTWRPGTGESQVRLDSLSLAFPHQSWTLARSGASLHGRRPGRPLRDTLRLRSTDGSGEVRVSGTVPGDAPGKLDASVSGLDLLDVFGVLERDTTALDGWGSLDLHLAGTRETPDIQGQRVGHQPGDRRRPRCRRCRRRSTTRRNGCIRMFRSGGPAQGARRQRLAAARPGARQPDHAQARRRAADHRRRPTRSTW